MMTRSSIVLFGLCCLVGTLHSVVADDDLEPLLRRRGLHRAQYLPWPLGREKSVEVVEEITYGNKEEYRWEKDMNTMSVGTGGSKTSKGDDDDNGPPKTSKGDDDDVGNGGKGNASSSVGSSSEEGPGKGAAISSSGSSSSPEGKGAPWGGMGMMGTKASKGSKGSYGNGYGKGSYGKGSTGKGSEMSMEMSFKYKYGRKNQRALVDTKSEECFMGAICENSGGALSVCCEDDTSSVIGCSTCGDCKADAGLPVGCCASNGEIFMPPFNCGEGELCCNVGGDFKCTEAVGGLCPTNEISLEMH